MIKDRVKRRKLNIRAKISGTQDRPRLSVYQSLGGIAVQAIDDERGVTLAACSHRGKRGEQAMSTFATAVYDKLSAAGIKRIAFDRNGRKYHGNLKWFADALRAKGIDF